MEGRDFAPPPHLLSERSALVHRAASRIASAGHSNVQHPGHFQPGKYYPSPIPMAPHSGSGLMGNSSASFMGTFLASSLGSPPSHPPHPSGPPSSPSEPSFRGGPHSSASQIWFPHSHEAPGYPRFSGSLASTFLPMSHLDHHGNSSVLYGQHRFYDTQKDNFYLRGLPSQPALLSANHSFPPISRAAPGHPLGSCSRERDGGGGLHKSLKEGGGERGVVLGAKDKDRAGSKQEAKDRQQHGHHPGSHHHPQHPQHPAGLEEESGRALERHKAGLALDGKEDPLGRGKHLSACLLSAKVLNGEPGAGAKGPLSSCGGAAGGGPGRQAGSRCAKEAAIGEVRVSGHPADCLESRQMLHHSVSYSVAPPLSMSSAAGRGDPGGFPCLQLHPSHPHHPHHHHHHHHPDFYCPPPPPPLAVPSAQEKGSAGGGRELKVTGPTFVPSVGHLGDKASGPFQLANPDCRGGGGGAKDKTLDKNNNSGSGPPSSCQRKQHQQQQQQHAYGKADKAPDWLQSNHQHLQQQQQHHPSARSRSLECISSADLDLFRPSLPQGAKGGPSGKSGPYVSTPPFRDCSHSGPPTSQPSEGKAVPPQGGGGGGGGGGAGCTLQRDGQKVARIRHQQHNRPGPDSTSSELAQGSSGQDMKRKLELASLGYSISGQQQQQQALPSWAARGHQAQVEEEQRKAYLDSFSSRQQGQPQQQGMASQNQQETGQQGSQGESSAMKSLLKYSTQQQPLLLSQKSPFGGLGSLKTAGGGGGGGGGSSCALQDAKQALPPRKGPASDGERSDCSGRGREAGDAPHGEGEVRQPPVGIAVAVARQREPPCRPLDGHPGHSRQGRVLPAMKGVSRSVFPLDPDSEEERRRLCEDPLGLPCLDRERELLIRDNKDRVEFARIHPSSSCHGDLTSHLMVTGGTSLQASQLGADPAAHAHPAHHHWMPRTGSPSLWMTGHSYGISHAALHQNLPPGFSAAMPSPLQPVLPMPQDPPTQLVVLPTEPAAHPATHHLDVMEQPSLWPPVYGTRGPASHMQHPAVYSRSQFLRQQELYALQQHQHQQQQQQQQQHHQQQQQHQQQHRAAQAVELQHRHSHSQRKAEDPSMELDNVLPEPRTPKTSKPFSFAPSNKSVPSPSACGARLSPCCRSPSLRPHPKSTPCTPCPAPSPAAAAPRSPALSPAPPHASKGAESQDKRGEGQPPQDYPQSLEPDLPPGYTYPAITMGYSSGPSPQDVRLAEPADLEAVQAEPAEPTPRSLSSVGEGPECEEVVTPMRTLEEEEPKAVEPGGGVEGGGSVPCCTPPELEQGRLFTCTATEDEISETPVPCPSAPTSPTVARDVVEDSLICNEDVGLGEERQGKQEEEGEREAGSEEREEDLAPGCSADIHASDTADNETSLDPGRKTPSEASVELLSSPLPTLSSPQSGDLRHSTSGAWVDSFSLTEWPAVPSSSLELLIAAALCAERDDPPPPSPAGLPQNCPGTRGMELLSELAYLELQQHRKSVGQSQGEELLTFDLQSLATLAAARSLELSPLEVGRPGTERHCPVRRALNLRRKCSWTPRHEPVCPVKVAMETMDGQELAMRVRLAELQRRYKEKQRELAKLQRKHDHQKEETSRSPARRGPGRPRKRKCAPGGTVVTAEAPRRVRSLGAGLDVLCEDLRGGETQRKKKKLTNRSFDRLNSTQMKARCGKQSGRQGALSSKLARKVSQLKQKAKAKRVAPAGAAFRRRETQTPSVAPPRLCRGQRPPGAEEKRAGLAGGHTDTAGRADRAAPEGWAGRVLLMRRERKGPVARLPPRARSLRAGNGKPKQEAAEEKETSPSESESSEQEEEEGSYDSEEGDDNIKAPPSKDPPPSSALIGPSPSSVVKLEANQKAKNKKERQRLLGALRLSGVDGEVKVRKRGPCKATPLSAAKRRLGPREQEGGKRKRPPRQQQQQLWGPLGSGGPYRRGAAPHALPTPSERLKKATRKSGGLPRALSKDKGGWLGGVQCARRPENVKGKRISSKQSKGRAVSRLLESFAADEGFQMDEDTSFSEGDGDHTPQGAPLQSRRSPPAVPNCTLAKELLVDGLKVLIPKEDELLYAAYVHTLQLPDIYSIVIEGERGNRPRIYSLEQLLQEAVLDVCPESEAVLAAGTRVCAYWSERSRCLYPGYVRRGGPGEDEKEGSVMVEFDDGDRGRISLSNIRLLPPDYQIHCTEPSPALLITNGSRRCRKSTAEKPAPSDTSSERPENNERTRSPEKKTATKAKPGKPKTINSGTKSPVSEGPCKTSTPLLGWPAVAVPKKRTPHNLFQLNGTPKKTLKGKEADVFPLLTAPAAAPAKGIFSSSFEVDSFSSIANGYSQFGSQPSMMSLSPRDCTPASRGRKPSEPGLKGRKAGSAEFLVKLDHEGVTSPKTKNGKALLLLGAPGHGNRMEKAFGAKVTEISSPMGYSHPILLVKDNKKSGSTRAELLLKGATQLRKPSSTLGLGEYTEFGLNCHSDCHSSYSDMDEEDEEEDERRAALAAASGGLRTAGRFLSRLSVSSSSSGSSSSSSSGSLSSSSLCSSDNDSSYSSEDEEGSTLLLQSCLSSHHALLQPPEPPSGPSQRSFVAKAMAVPSSKGGGNNSTNKPLKRKEVPRTPSSVSSTKNPKDLAKRQRLPSVDNRPKISAFLPARQLWRWSGNPTQRRGVKGKARKLFYKAIVRGRETVCVGDCAVFLSAGRPHLPYIGRIESFWESWASNMVVKVKWFYHPEETKLGKRHRDGKHALYQSCHEDENDVQTISHKCQVVSREEYEHLSRGRKHNNSQDLYYLAGTYDPTSGQLVTAEGVSILC
ncbi:BAH and coiled-coil domain-containing protein 1 isoform X2 [Lepisosteus oculatus]|uniref:BAH and coiled-coil domain-containing protein 1 isoform X2 n=1 Tax=Lepisosteus oculatus TaxID=7918 RepID=UPI00371436ED